MRARAEILGVLVGLAACGEPPEERIVSPEPAPDAGITPETPTHEGPADGMCAQWLVGSLDLSAFPDPSSTATLAARADARGGITVWTTDNQGAVTAVAFRADGTMEGAPVNLVAGAPPGHPRGESSGDAGNDGGDDGDDGAGNDGGLAPPPIARDVEATTDGWLVSWGSNYGAGWVTVYGSLGAPFYGVPLASNWATVDVGSDGSIGIDDGANVGWVHPGQLTEQIALTYRQTAGADYDRTTGPSGGWGHGVAYVTAQDLSANMESVSAGGPIVTIPGPTLAQTPCTVSAPPYQLLPGGSGDGASVVSLCPESTPVQLAFVSTSFPPRAFAFDPAVPVPPQVGSAARLASHGVVLAWAGEPASTQAPVPLGLTEVAPTGARGSVVPLGVLPVVPQHLVVAGTDDGATYFVVAWNGAVRGAYQARCAP